MFATRDVGVHMSYYISKYKAERNESLMYGVDADTYWFDYDLVSAYTKKMTDIPLPDYYNANLIKGEEVINWNDPELMIDSILWLTVISNFPLMLNTPSIPCYVDKTTTVYPLKGTAFLTGPEFLLAKKNKQTKPNKQQTTKTTNNKN